MRPISQTKARSLERQVAELQRSIETERRIALREAEALIRGAIVEARAEATRRRARTMAGLRAAFADGRVQGLAMALDLVERIPELEKAA